VAKIPIRNIRVHLRLPRHSPFDKLMAKAGSFAVKKSSWLPGFLLKMIGVV
jgi:hypothetical protein